MFHVYDFKNFSDWYKEANALARAKFLKEGGHIENFSPLNISASEKDHFLLFENNEVGTCGFATLTPLFETSCTTLKKITLSAGTWILKDVQFFVSQQFDQADFDFLHIIEKFYLGLFQKVWDISVASKNTMALVFDADARLEDYSLHTNLSFFGGFKFQKRLIEEDHEQSVALGVFPLNDETYKHYLEKKTIHEKHFGTVH